MRVRRCILPALLACCGCTSTYLADRANDAKDMFDPGITLSQKPGIALHLDFFNVMPLGYSHIEGKYLGVGNRQAGIMDIHDHTWGLLLCGSEELQIGKFDPRDPHQFHQDARKKLEAKGAALPTRTQAYKEGAAWLSENPTPPPWPQFFS